MAAYTKCSVNLQIFGDVSEKDKKLLTTTFQYLYSQYVDICNDGLISLLNDEWNLISNEIPPSNSEEDLLAYNRFMASHFEIVARTVNRVYGSDLRMNVRLYVDPDTADCRGMWNGCEVRFDWDSFQLEDR